MVVGERGDHGETVLGLVEEACSIPSGTVTAPHPKMEANTVKAKGSSIVPATLRPAPKAMVRELSLSLTVQP